MRISHRFYRQTFPEIDRFPSERDATLALERAGIYRFWAGTLAGLFFAPVLPMMIIEALWSAPSPMLAILLQVSGAGLGFLAVVVLCRRSIQRSLRQQLRARGEAVCLRCGYDLTGNVSGACPECGGAVA